MVARQAQRLRKKKESGLVESWEYIRKNWKKLRRRVQKEEGVTAAHESHISHVLSSTDEFTADGWSREGADRLSQIRYTGRMEKTC